MSQSSTEEGTTTVLDQPTLYKSKAEAKKAKKMREKKQRKNGSLPHNSTPKPDS